MNQTIPRGIHVAIIMDGNGRWATGRGQLRTAGHIAGARTVRRIVETAPGCGIGTLTLYAFSADNWRRPSREVALLMRLFRRYLVSEVARCVTNGVRMRIIGRRDRIPAELLRAITNAEHATRDGRKLELRIAVDYSSRDAIMRAAAKLPAGMPDGDRSRHAFARLLSSVDHGIGESRDVDLLIRTGGEQRLSDFLLWECAYAELYFTRRMWPEFAPADLSTAVEEFHARERRFGTVPEAAAG
ncbi:MAG: di-trans,poly-cis-decaprenylcistransferase [Gemmatimonadaceae bacterium]|nr:di-trans,poly-cis-decaprenylcistransferase [Gemmatimonadaceae bacterium]